MRDHSRKESRLRPLAACEPSSDGRPRPRGRRLMRAIYFDLLLLTAAVGMIVIILVGGAR
jgi:hypothetical protein